MAKRALETMIPRKVLTVWAIYSRLGYTPNPYPHKHAISDQEQGELDVLVGAARMELGDTNLFNGRAA